MKYIHYIDEMAQVRTFVPPRKDSVIARPLEAYGLLKWEIRLRHAWACLTGRAIAVRFHEEKI